MSTSAPIQKGTAVLVGFGSAVYSGYVLQDGFLWTKGAVATNLTDENGGSLVWIFENPHDQYNFDVVIKGTSVPTVVKPGDIVSIANPVGSTVSTLAKASVPLKLSRLAAIMSLDLIKEESMSYTT